VLDRDTTQTLDQIFSSRDWWQRPFYQVYEGIEKLKKNPDTLMRRALARAGMDGYFEYQGRPPGPLPGYKAGTPPGPLGLSGTATDAGVELTFGAGIKNKSNMVPVPRRSGATYEAFRRLQRAINRLLAATGEFSSSPPGGRVGEDGVIGSSTLGALRRVQDAHFAQSFPGDDSTAGMAAHAVSLASILEGKANSLGVSPSANAGSPATPAESEQTVKPLTKGQVTLLSAQAPIGAGIGPVGKYLSFFALAAGVAWYAAQKRKEKPRR